MALPDARTPLDRWILSRLDGLVGEVGAAYAGYDAQAAGRAIESFVADLSNWYVRRNRRRFWKGELDADKRAAYATLYEVLTTLCRLMAPITPHLTDAIWDNLVATVDASQPDSVHLTDFPERVPGRADPALDAAVDLARRTVALGRAARAATGLRTRQPLRAARVKLPAGATGFSSDAALDDELRQEIQDELNVHEIGFIPKESELVERTLYPLLPVIGPRHGAAVGAIMAATRSGDWTLNDDGTATVGGATLQPDEFQLTARARAGHEVAEEGDVLVALDTEVDEELAAEGMAREVAHRLQALRRSAGYEISDRVRVAIDTDPGTTERLGAHRDWLADELLATTVEIGPSAVLEAPDASDTIEIDGTELALTVARA